MRSTTSPAGTVIFTPPPASVAPLASTSGAGTSNRPPGNATGPR